MRADQAEGTTLSGFQIVSESAPERRTIVSRAARAVIVRDDGRRPIATTYHNNVYDGSCPRGEFDHGEDVDYRPPATVVGTGGSAISAVKADALADLFAFERRTALKRPGTLARTKRQSFGRQVESPARREAFRLA